MERWKLKFEMVSKELLALKGAVGAPKESQVSGEIVYSFEIASGFLSARGDSHSRGLCVQSEVGMASLCLGIRSQCFCSRLAGCVW